MATAVKERALRAISKVSIFLQVGFFAAQEAFLNGELVSASIVAREFVLLAVSVKFEIHKKSLLLMSSQNF